MSKRRRYETISMIREIIAKYRGERTMPQRQDIRKWFKSLPKLQRRRLRRIDWGRWVAGDPIQRCHVMGVAIIEKFLIWAVKRCKWYPQRSLIKILTKQVINYPGNFVLCQKSYNLKWSNGGQNTIRNILDQGDIDDIRFPSEQVYQLIHVLNTIKKRFIKLFEQRCLENGVPENVIHQISRYFNKIDKKATKVREQRERAAFEIPSHDLDESDFGSQVSSSF